MDPLPEVSTSTRPLAARRRLPALILRRVKPSRSADLLADRALWTGVLILAAGVPLVYSTGGRDPFRVPKLALLQGGGILLGALLAAAAILGWVDVRQIWRERAAALLAGSMLAWAALSASFSEAPRVSWESVATVAAAGSLFLTLLVTLPRRGLTAAAVLMSGAVVNGLVVIAQTTGLWNPFTVQESGRLARIGLLGNPNDVAMFLVAPTLVSFALALTAEGRLRWYGASASLVMAAAILMSESATAVAACAVAALLMAVSSPARTGSYRGPLTIGLAALVIAAAFAGGNRVVTMLEALGEGGLDTMATGRPLAFASAVEMLRDHPLLGVGPGMFGWHFFDYAPVAQEVWGPFSFAAGVRAVYTEAHNDHLQVAAEGGVPALLLFWGALALIAWRTIRVTGATPRARFARALGVPFAVGLFVLCLAQFPLQLPASLLSLVITSALCIAWSSDEPSAP